MWQLATHSEVIMPSESDLAPLIQLVEKVLVFLGRPGVQLQLLAMLLALLGAWLITQKLWLQIQHQLSSLQQSALSQQNKHYWKTQLRVDSVFAVPPDWG